MAAWRKPAVSGDLSGATARRYSHVVMTSHRRLYQAGGIIGGIHLCIARLSSIASSASAAPSRRALAAWRFKLEAALAGRGVASLSWPLS